MSDPTVFTPETPSVPTAIPDSFPLASASQSVPTPSTMLSPTLPAAPTVAASSSPAKPPKSRMAPIVGLIVIVLVLVGVGIAVSGWLQMSDNTAYQEDMAPLTHEASELFADESTKDTPIEDALFTETTPVEPETEVATATTLEQQLASLPSDSRYSFDTYDAATFASNENSDLTGFLAVGTPGSEMMAEGDADPTSARPGEMLLVAKFQAASLAADQQFYVVIQQGAAPAVLPLSKLSDGSYGGWVIQSADWEVLSIQSASSALAAPSGPVWMRLTGGQQ